MSIAEIEALASAAIAALNNGDYATAIHKAMAARMRLATSPNVNQALDGGGSRGIAWGNVAQIDAFIADCRRFQATTNGATAGPFQTSKIHPVRPCNLDRY